MKKTFILALIAVFALAGFAFAENRVEVKVTSEPIQYHATCDKAGGFTLEFDEGTQIRDDDVITIDLDYGARICRTVDLEISAGGNGGEWTGAVGAGGNIPVTGAPLIDPTQGSVVTGDGVFFRLYGAAGSQRLTLTVTCDADAVAGDDWIDVTDFDVNQPDKLILYFLDQKTCDDFAVDGIYIDSDNDDDYDTCITDIGDNTLCIDVSNYDAYTVNGNMDSKLDKFTFIPSNPQIAHVVDPITYEEVDCKTEFTGRIAVGEETQFEEDCVPFDWETGAGYCLNDSSSNLFLIETTESGVYFENEEYQIQMEILTDGVYWTNDPIAVTGYGATTNACAAGPSVQVFGNQAEYAYTQPVQADGVVPETVDCTPNGAQVVTTDCATLPTAAGVSNIKTLSINIPRLVYNIEEIVLGEHVEVVITLSKCPCGMDNSWTVDLGILGCDSTPVQGDTFELLYPYFTPMSNDNYWDGFAIVNLGSTDGQATLNFFETDGDQGSMIVSVPAQGMFVSTLQNMLGAAAGGQVVQAMAQTAGAGTLGDARCYVVGCTDFNCDGFAFMGNSSAANAKGESMGYLPRDNKLCGAIGLCPSAQ